MQAFHFNVIYTWRMAVWQTVDVCGVVFLYTVGRYYCSLQFVLVEDTILLKSSDTPSYFSWS